MIPFTKSEQTLLPDTTRVVAIPFVPGSSTLSDAPNRVDDIAERVLAMTDDETTRLLDETRRHFADRHRDIEAIWEEGFIEASRSSPRMANVEGDRRRLLGAYFVQEYAYEAAALCNPSIVPIGPVADDGSLPCVISLRAIGEGHISSIAFRTATVHSGGRLEIDPPSPYATRGRRRSPTYDKATFVAKLAELGADPDITGTVFDQLPDRFEVEALDRELASFPHAEFSPAAVHETTHLVHWLASSNYELTFDDIPLSERVMSPAGPADSRGMEDARFVRFVDDDGSVVYYATYTAWDGHTVLPQLIETSDFQVFRAATLNGTYVHNKGMAFFPRKIDGRYVALSRHDQERMFVMHSDNRRFWHNAELVQEPVEPWEAVQLGNCGSPIETDAGWLVLTHGVGPMRRYCIGAVLLDLDNPSKVIGRLRSPLLEPEPDERDGYVPNVVYSCGGLVHDGWLVLPYAYSDRAVRSVTVPLADLLDAME